jgi:hypothetical protein
VFISSRNLLFSTDGAKAKAHRLLWQWACFLKFKCELGSSFSGQRHSGHLATTHTHALSNNCHAKKVQGSKLGCQAKPISALAISILLQPTNEHSLQAFRHLKMNARMGLIHFFFDTFWFGPKRTLFNPGWFVPRVLLRRLRQVPCLPLLKILDSPHKPGYSAI